jgi:hypothetical protein
MTDEQISDHLKDVGIGATPKQVGGWSVGMKKDAFDWVAQVKSAGANPNAKGRAKIKVPQKPDFLRNYGKPG